jgi:hypothetical protein
VWLLLWLWLWLTSDAAAAAAAVAGNQRCSAAAVDGLQPCCCCASGCCCGSSCCRCCGWPLALLLLILLRSRLLRATPRELPSDSWQCHTHAGALPVPSPKLNHLQAGPLTPLKQQEAVQLRLLWPWGGQVIQLQLLRPC